MTIEGDYESVVQTSFQGSCLLKTPAARIFSTNNPTLTDRDCISDIRAEASFCYTQAVAQ
jgi:hypothetical protein